MRGLAEKTIGDVFITGYLTATDGIRDASISSVEDVIIDMIHSRVIVEALITNQHFERWSGSDGFIGASIGRIVNDPGFLAPVAAFIKQHATNAVEEELNSKLKVKK